jgi:hypothetical protein
MATANLNVDKQVRAWARTIQFDKALSPEATEALLEIRFSAKDRKRMHTLSAKARASTLTDRERVEIDAYEKLGCFIDILHSKARRALKQRQATS